MIIDFHAHYHDEPGYLNRLLAEMDRLGIDRVCLSGLGPMFGMKTTPDVAAAVRAHPDRVIGFAFIRPGWHGPDEIRRWHHEGFRGVKVSCPRDDYDSREYYPLWDAAQELDMPILFHTGVVTTPHARPEDDISSARMHPMMLEPITRAFPRLKVVCAHLGIHWNADAAELLRMRPNAYADITGEPTGYRARLTPEKWRELLWWSGAFDKLVFGTDVTPDKIEGNLRYDTELFEALGLPAEAWQRYVGGNAREILGL